MRRPRRPAGGLTDATSNTHAATNTDHASDAAGNPPHPFTVTGAQTIHCAGCEQRIGNALRRLPGIREVQASHQTQGVRVRIDPAHVDAEQVRAKLAQLGYEAAPRVGA